MALIIDLTGQKFNRLAVIGRDGSKRGRPLWHCKCDCGNDVYLNTQLLTKGITKSCGCIHIKHGCSSNKNNKGTREYLAWSSARKRCFNPKHKFYADYGGRGIVVHEVWSDFVVFLEDMGPCPDNFELDRIDNNGNYEPGNCRWIDRKTQVNNRRNTTIVTLRGESMPASNAADILGVPAKSLRDSMREGFTPDEVDYRIKNNLYRKKRRSRNALS